MSSSEQKSGTTTAPTQSATSQNTSTSVTTNNSTYRVPGELTLQHACKLAIVEDKPIMLDYWTESVDKKALIGVRESGEKLLVKSAEEYTSPIAKFYKSGNEYIIITENSIYLVSSDIPTKKIS
jgi:hypothetical protein